MPNKIYEFKIKEIYGLYLDKVLKKGRSIEELNTVISWLTGYEKSYLKELDDKTSVEEFFTKAPQPHPNRCLIKGSICGVKLEEITDPLMKEVRYLDKLVDELARGRAIEKILRK